MLDNSEVRLKAKQIYNANVGFLYMITFWVKEKLSEAVADPVLKSDSKEAQRMQLSRRGLPG